VTELNTRQAVVRELLDELVKLKDGQIVALVLVDGRLRVRYAPEKSFHDPVFVMCATSRTTAEQLHQALVELEDAT
jgi:hypothetical protein